VITVREIVVNGITLSVAKIVNSSGASVELLNLGATVKSLFVPDRNGMLRNVVLGYDETERYLANTHYYGSTIGRYANRISDSSFSLNGKAYRLQSPTPTTEGTTDFTPGFSTSPELPRRTARSRCDTGVPTGRPAFRGGSN